MCLELLQPLQASDSDGEGVELIVGAGEFPQLRQIAQRIGKGSD